MGFSARSLVVLALVLAPAVAMAQGTAPAPPPGGGGAPAPAPAAGGASGGGAAPAPGAAAGGDKGAEKGGDKGGGDVGGFSFHDKPVRRAARGVIHRHVKGPIATLPGFEQSADGGSRFFVQLTEQVPVEEQKAQGSITYVLKGAHVNKYNNTNALVTVHFNTPVSRARLVQHGNDLFFVLDLRAAVAPVFKMQDAPDKTAMLTIDFPKGDYLAPGDAQVTPAAGDQGSAGDGTDKAARPAPKKQGKRGRGRTKGAPPPPPPPASGPTQ
jgi:hypothetical protein